MANKKRKDPHLESVLFSKITTYKELYKKVQKKLNALGVENYRIDEVVLAIYQGSFIINDNRLLKDIESLIICNQEIDDITKKLNGEFVEKNEQVLQEEKDDNMEQTVEQMKTELKQIRADIYKALEEKGYNKLIIEMAIDSLTDQMHLDSDEKINEMVTNLILLQNQIDSAKEEDPEGNGPKFY